MLSGGGSVGQCNTELVTVFQQDGQLLWTCFDFQFYRNCTPNTIKAATTTGLHKLVSFV